MELTPAGKLVERYREDVKGWSKTYLCEQARITRNAYRDAIHGKRDTHLDTWGKLADTLGIDKEVLLRKVHGPRPPGSYRPFLRWSIGIPSFWMACAGLLVAAVFLQLGWKENVVPTAVHAVQAVVIGGMLLLQLRTYLADPTPLGLRGVSADGFTAPPLRDRFVKLQIAIEATKDFRRYWIGGWVCWGGLYLAMASIPHPWGWRTRFLLNLVQNATTVCFVMSFLVLSARTIDESRRRKWWPRLLGLAILVSLALPELLVGSLAGEWSGREVFDWISGFSQGTAIALLVSRLGSLYVGAPVVVTSLLYLYAVIQGGWPALTSNARPESLLTFVALGLKCLFFMLISWLLTQKLIVFYMRKARELDGVVQEERWEWLNAYESGKVGQL